MNTKWTYKIVEVKPSFTGLKRESIEEQLNLLGSQGWELVSVHHNGLGAWLYVKKGQ